MMQRLTIEEAAAHLGVTKEAVQDRIRKGELVECQAPDLRGFIWVREHATDESPRSDSAINQRIAMLEKEVSGLRQMLKAIRGLDQNQQLETLCERVKALEAVLALTSQPAQR